MKFGFFSPFLDRFGSGERYMLTLASHFSKGHIVDIFWDDMNIKPPLSRFLKIDLSRTRFVTNIFNLPTSKKLFATLGYNCIFILSDGSIQPTLAAKNILHFQRPFKFPKPNIQTKLKLKRYKYIVCNSQFTKEYIDKSFNVNAKVIYPPVNIKLMTPSTKEKIILSVGRFSENQVHSRKQEILIEVFKEISKNSTGWKLILVGQVKKKDEKYVRSLKKLSRGHAIRIMENLSFEKLKTLYSHASIYWQATGFGEEELKNPEKMEHFGIATVEAQAAGAVPVVIGKGGQKEIVQGGVNGLLWNTKAELYEKTLSLIENHQLLEKLSGSAQKSSRKFSGEKFIEEYEKIIL